MTTMQAHFVRVQRRRRAGANPCQPTQNRSTKQHCGPPEGVVVALSDAIPCHNTQLAISAKQWVLGQVDCCSGC